MKDFFEGKYSVTVKELCYYLFFGLMIAAKGMGLDSGDRLYYLLSAAAVLFIACKLYLTTYSRKEFVIVVLLCLLGLVSYVNSGRPGLFLSILAVVGMKDIRLDRLFRMGLILFGTCFFATVCLAAGGVIPNPLAVHEKEGIGEVIRWGMGYSTGNVFHISYFILTALYVRQRGERYGGRDLLCLLAGNLTVFLFSLSYTGVAVTTFYLLVSLYMVKRGSLNRLEKALCYLPLPFFLLFSLGAPFLTDYPVGQKLNMLLQARLGFSRYYLTSQPLTLFGTRMKNVPNFWIIMDNGYVYILMTFGIIAFFLFFGAYALLIRKYVKESAGMELAVIFSFLLYGIMEQFISNAFMNISVLYMGVLLFENGREAVGQGEDLSSFQEKAVRLPGGGKRIGGKRLVFPGIRGNGRLQKAVCSIRHRAGTIVAFGFGIGMLFSVLYFTLDPKPAYVTVPLKALPYVDAQSVLLHTKEPCESEEELKQIMRAYEEKARAAAEKEEERLADLLEFSLPQTVYESGNYDAFRIRLFQGVYGKGEEEGRAFLEKLLSETEKDRKALSLSAASIYEERVGKDFGTDRIEHVKGSENYLIEKSGRIVRIETVRTGILRFLPGLLLGMAVAAAIFSGKPPVRDKMK